MENRKLSKKYLQQWSRCYRNAKTESHGQHDGNAIDAAEGGRGRAYMQVSEVEEQGCSHSNIPIGHDGLCQGKPRLQSGVLTFSWVRCILR